MCTCYDLIYQTLLDQITTLLGNNIDSFLLHFRSTKKLSSEVEKKIFLQAALESNTVRNIIYRFVQLMHYPLSQCTPPVEIATPPFLSSLDTRCCPIAGFFLRKRDHPFFNTLVDSVSEVRLTATFIQQILDPSFLYCCFYTGKRCRG